jgi:NADH-quinone oxidoreductase subunit N
VVTLAGQAVQISYSATQAWNDLANIGPIVAVTVALLVAVVVDLVLPRGLRGPAVAGIAGIGLVTALAIAGYRLANGYGGLAYYRFATGDSFALFFEMLFAIAGVMTVIVSSSYVRRRGLREAELHVLVLAAVIGMMSLAAANSLVTVFLGLELLSIALYIACGYNRIEEASQEAAAKYLIIGGFAGAFVLYGMALVYGATGSTVLTDIAARVTSDSSGNPLLLLGVLLMGVGFAFKVSAAPFHMWTPDVYQGAPLPVTAFMSVGTKAAAFAMILRVFGYGLGHISPEWQVLIAFVAATSMIVGNLLAIVQSSLKRMLAYSGVAQAGYILVGVLAGGRAGVAAVLFYLFGYLFMNFGAFAVVSTLAGPDSDGDRYEDLNGLGYRHPTLGVLMAIFMLSLAGFPPMVGFFGKVFLFAAGIAAGWTWLVVLTVLTSVVSVYYYFRVLFHVWSPLPEAPPRAVLGSVLGPYTVVLVSAVFAVALGLVAGQLFQMGANGAGPILAAGR